MGKLVLHPGDSPLCIRHAWPFYSNTIASLSPQVSSITVPSPVDRKPLDFDCSSRSDTSAIAQSNYPLISPQVSVKWSPLTIYNLYKINHFKKMQRIVQLMISLQVFTIVFGSQRSFGSSDCKPLPLNGPILFLIIP